MRIEIKKITILSGLVERNGEEVARGKKLILLFNYE